MRLDPSGPEQSWFPPAGGRSSNGRTHGSEPWYRGSNPCLPAKLIQETSHSVERQFPVKPYGWPHHVVGQKISFVDLEREVSSQRFRQDLFYRLSVISIRVPALRERREDIPLLIETFLQNACARAGRRIELAPGAVQALTSYRWPGNVRELENTIERLVVFSRGSVVEESDLPFKGSTPDLHERLFADLPALDEVERRYLLHVIEQVGGNRTRAAEVLGIDRRTLYRMAERFGIDLKEDVPGSGAA